MGAKLKYEKFRYHATQSVVTKSAVIPSGVTLYYGYVTFLRDASRLFVKQGTVGLF